MNGVFHLKPSIFLCAQEVAGCGLACMQHFKELLSSRTKVVSLVHVSNMLGSVLDTDYVVEEARKVSVGRPWGHAKSKKYLVWSKNHELICYR